VNIKKNTHTTAHIKTAATKKMSDHTRAGGNSMWGYPVELWEHVFFWATGVAAVAGGIAVIAALVSGILGYRISDAVQREANKKIAEANERAATAHERAAKSELDVQSLRALARRAGYRVLDFQKFATGLKEVPKRIVEIWYKADDVEVDRFSQDLYRALEIGGWPVSRRVLKPDDKLGGMSLAKIEGILVISHNPDDVLGLNNFMFTIIGALPFGGQGAGTTAPELPDGRVVVVIGTSEKL
jgi:hypothetical protein